MLNTSHRKSRTRRTFIYFAITALALTVIGCASTYSTRSYRRVDAGVYAEYGELNQWGSWYVSDRFGDVWCPDVPVGWAPFTYGNWVWTDRGWLWSSYEPYGWLVYHYGNWYYDDNLGWFWVPGDTWSYAPVEWYANGEYVCWAPDPPAGAAWPQPWQSGATVAWIAVKRQDFLADNVGTRRTATWMPAHPQPGTVWRHAPDIRTVTRSSDRHIKPVHMRRTKTKVQSKTLYRPNLPHTEKLKVERYRKEFKHPVHPAHPKKGGRGKPKSHGKP